MSISSWISKRDKLTDIQIFYKRDEPINPAVAQEKKFFGKQQPISFVGEEGL
jgi:hypothetical protein